MFSFLIALCLAATPDVPTVFHGHYVLPQGTQGFPSYLTYKYGCLFPNKTDILDEYTDAYGKEWIKLKIGTKLYQRDGNKDRRGNYVFHEVYVVKYRPMWVQRCCH